MIEFNGSELLTLRLLLNEMMNDCPECGSERDEIDFKDLPSELQKAFKELKDVAKFLHCRVLFEF